MTGNQVNLEMIALRRRAAGLQARYEVGERSALYCEARALTDEVVCLMDEAPAPNIGTITKLADQCEVLLRSLGH